MKIVVIGGTGLIGSKLIARLQEHGHEGVAAAPNTGVNTLTGEGVAEVLVGADVVIDVSNSPSFADDDVLDFFTRSTVQPAGCREGGRRRSPRRAVDRGHRPSPDQRRPARKGRPGAADP